MALEKLFLEKFGKEKVERIATKILKGEYHTSEIVKVILSKEEPISRRAVWVLSRLAEKAPAFVDPFVKKLIPLLFESDLHPGIVRGVLKVLEYCEIPEELETKLLDRCFEFIVKPDWPFAIQAYAMTVIGRICERYPGLIQEFRETVTHSPFMEKSSYRARLKLVFKKLNKFNEQNF